MDPTFRNYNSQQASSYAAHRTSYTPSLYSEILKYHSGTNSNAEFDVLLDVGCGPGTATRDLAMYFNHAIGIDPSPEMIARAKSAGGQTKTGNEIGYELLQAENLASSKILKPASVDVLTAGMAAHWFDMSEFWIQAARILKPGGTVALWTKASLYCRKFIHPSIHPYCLIYLSYKYTKIQSQKYRSKTSNTKDLTSVDPSTPSASKIQKILSELENETLRPYTLAPNIISSNLYSNLQLPWSSDLNPNPNLNSTEPQSQPQSQSQSYSFPLLAAIFPETQHKRSQYNENGHISPPETDFFTVSQEYTVSELGSMLGTASMVTRWRDDNEDLAGTEEGDCVLVAMERIEGLLREERERKNKVDIRDGDEDENENKRELKIRVGSACALLLFKKVETGLNK